MSDTGKMVVYKYIKDVGKYRKPIYLEYSEQNILDLIKESKKYDKIIITNTLDCFVMEIKDEFIKECYNNDVKDTFNNKYQQNKYAEPKRDAVKDSQNLKATSENKNIKNPQK